MPISDVSVRLALPEDAKAIAAVQARAWQSSYSDIVPAEVLAALPVEMFAAKWRDSIERPVEAKQRVLVALERTTVRGFTTTSPGADPDADPGTEGAIAELAVDPDHRGQGHGSRLLHAAADTLRADRFEQATIWVNSSDDDLRAFLLDQGWAPDGAMRELDLYGDGSVTIRQVRLHTNLRPE